MNEPINLKYSKLDNHPIKTYRNINYNKNLINDEDETENDINSTYKNKNEFTNKSININKPNLNMTKSKKIFNDNELYNKFRKNYNKNEDKKVSNNNNSNNNSNIINNYMFKNLYRKEEDEADNSSEDINLDMKNQSHIPMTSRFKPHGNIQLFSNISNPNNFNTSKQINKSNSYFKDNKYLNLKNSDYNNFSTHQIPINLTNKNNGKNSNNFNNNTGKINKNFIPFIGKNKRLFKNKKYSNMENFKQDIDFTEKDSFDTLNIDDLMNKVNYTGDKNDFYRYLEELKLKADITTIVQNMFKSEINSYNGLEKYLENNSQAKNKKILDMYKFLFEKLIQKNQNKINDKLIDKFYDEICSCQE